MQSDPYLIPVYQAVQPSLPSNLTSLNINKIKKGTFSNGTISYQIYYGSISSVDTHYLIIFFNPSTNQITYLKLNTVQQVPQYSFSSSSSFSSTPSYTSSKSTNGNGASGSSR